MTTIRRVQIPINKSPNQEPWSIQHMFSYEFFRFHIIQYIGERCFYSNLGSVDLFFYSLTHLKQYEESYGKVFKDIYEKVAKEILFWDNYGNFNMSIYFDSNGNGSNLLKPFTINFERREIWLGAKNVADICVVFPKDHIICCESEKYYKEKKIFPRCGYCSKWIRKTRYPFKQCLGERGYKISTISNMIKKNMKRNHAESRRKIKASVQKFPYLSESIHFVSNIKKSTVTPECSLYYSVDITEKTLWYLAFSSKFTIQRIGLDRIFDYDVDALRFMKKVKGIGEKLVLNTEIRDTILPLLSTRDEFEKSQQLKFEEDKENEIPEENDDSDSDYVDEEEDKPRRSKRRRIAPSVPVLNVDDYVD